MIDVNRIRATLQDRLKELEASERKFMDRDDYYVLSGRISGIEDAIEVIDKEIEAVVQAELEFQRNRNR